MIEQIELRQIIASNLIRLRKVSGLTQAELAQKINYTDKSVSKWERGEGAPDIFVLNQLAEIYKVTVNDIIGVKKVTPNRNKVQFNTIVAMLSSSIVWLVAVICYVTLMLTIKNTAKVYLCFVYAVPASSIVLLIFSCVGKIRSLNCLFTSISIWGFAVGLVLSLPIEHISLILIIGIPLQILTILWFLLKFDIEAALRRNKKQGEHQTKIDL